jgi:hypothetical protein
MLEAEGHLRETLRRAGASITAPASLRRRVRGALDRERGRSSWASQWLPAAAAALILLSFIWRGQVGSLQSDLVEATRQHARNLPVDVRGPDVAQVQRFFNEKLPFAVNLPDLHAAATQARSPTDVPAGDPDLEPLVRSAAMLGGRITHLRDRDAAYVRYELPRGRISVFVYSDPDFDVFENASVYQVNHRRVSVKRLRGYTVARWRYGDLVYSMVTDLPERETALILGSMVR